MTDKLTLADCFKYPKSKILDYTGSKDSPNDFENIYEYIHAQGSFDSRNLDYTTEDIFNDYCICNCKLILRDITELTDEEKQHIAKEYLFGVNPDRDIWEIGKLIYRSMNTYNDRDNTIPLINYLRSKNIMIEPEDWFKQGKAVRE